MNCNTWVSFLEVMANNLRHYEFSCLTRVPRVKCEDVEWLNLKNTDIKYVFIIPRPNGTWFIFSSTFEQLRNF